MANRQSKSKKEIRELSLKELMTKVRELEDHIFQLRMQWRTGQLGSTAMMGLARREMARVKTFLNQKNREASKTTLAKNA